MTNRIAFVLLLTCLIPTSPALSQGDTEDVADSVNFFQLNFPANDIPFDNSSVGLLEVDLITLRTLSDIPSGYLNMVLEGKITDSLSVAGILKLARLLGI